MPYKPSESSYLCCWNENVNSLLEQTKPAPYLFTQLADLLTMLGMAREAAIARTWTIIEPDEQNWKSHLKSWNHQLLNPDEVQELDSRTDLATGLTVVDELVKTSRLGEAIGLMKTLTENNNLAPHLCNKLGFLYEKQGDDWTAETWYRTSLHSQTTQPRVWLMLASCLLRQEAAAEALECVDYALKLHPNHPWGLKLRDRALGRIGAFLTISELKDSNKNLNAVTSALEDQVKTNISVEAKFALFSLLGNDKLTTVCIHKESLMLLSSLCEALNSPTRSHLVNVIAYQASQQEKMKLKNIGICNLICSAEYTLKRIDVNPSLVIFAPPSGGLPRCPVHLQVILNANPCAIIYKDSTLCLDQFEWLKSMRLYDLGEWRLIAP